MKIKNTKNSLLVMLHGFVKRPAAYPDTETTLNPLAASKRCLQCRQSLPSLIKLWKVCGPSHLYIAASSASQPPLDLKNKGSPTQSTTTGKYMADKVNCEGLSSYCQLGTTYTTWEEGLP